jgi:ABC-type transport system involved in cytochrome bd biosynthesis fused ATPase/permease subunit
LIITHREALIALADEVYTMHSGVLVPTQNESLISTPKAA